MLGKPEWFQPRKYLGWGIQPKTWQGWIYLVIALLLVAGIQIIPIFSAATKVYLTVLWAVLLIADVVDIMIKMKRDERDKVHEAISDRNALWVIMLVLILSVFYQIAKTGIAQNVTIDWAIIIALILGVTTKAITNIYLDRKD